MTIMAAIGALLGIAIWHAQGSLDRVRGALLCLIPAGIYVAGSLATPTAATVAPHDAPSA